MRGHASWSLMAALATAILSAGCATKPAPLYHWGNFARLQYDVLQRAGANPSEQIATMALLATKAGTEHAALPPGFRAHLGMLKLSLGDVEGARAAWRDEMSNFPESKHYMERLLTGLNKPAAGPTVKENPA